MAVRPLKELSRKSFRLLVSSQKETLAAGYICHIAEIVGIIGIIVTHLTMRAVDKWRAQATRTMNLHPSPIATNANR